MTPRPLRLAPLAVAMVLGAVSAARAADAHRLADASTPEPGEAARRHDRAVLRFDLDALEALELAAPGVSPAPSGIELKPEDERREFEGADTGPRSVYGRFAKPAPCPGDCADAPAFRTPVGQRLEPGDAGPPGADDRAQAWSPDVVHRRFRRDAGGRVGIPLGARGAVLVSAVVVDPPTTPEGRFLCDVATLAFRAASRPDRCGPDELAGASDLANPRNRGHR